MIGAHPTRGNRRDWSRTVCLVCGKTGGVEIDEGHRRNLIERIKHNGLTVRELGAPAVHFKCENKLNKLTLHKREEHYRGR